MLDPVALGFVNNHFLVEGAPETNLIKLTDPKFSEAPKTACLTKKVLGKVPFFTASRESIHRWGWTIGIGSAFGSWSARLSHAAFQQALLEGDEWQKNFFPTVSAAFLKAFQSMKDPSSQFLTILSLALSSLLGIGFCMTMRPLLNDSQEGARYALLKQEFAAIGDLLIARFERAKKEKNKEQLHHIQQIAIRLEANLPRIESLLQSGARLPKESVEKLVKLLRIPIQKITPSSETL